MMEATCYMITKQLGSFSIYEFHMGTISTFISSLKIVLYAIDVYSL